MKFNYLNADQRLIDLWLNARLLKIVLNIFAIKCTKECDIKVNIKVLKAY